METETVTTDAAVIMQHWPMIKSLYDSGLSHKKVLEHLQSIGNPAGDIGFDSFKAKCAVLKQIMPIVEAKLESSENTIRELTGQVADLTNQVELANHTAAGLAGELELSHGVITAMGEGYEKASEFSAGQTLEINPIESTGGSVGAVNPIIDVVGQGSTPALSGLTDVMRAQVEAMIIAAMNANNTANNANNTANKVRNAIKHPPRPDNIPSYYKGWNINVSNGYYQLFMRVNGKGISLHIGKVWSEVAADAAIAKYEARQAQAQQSKSGNLFDSK